MDVGTNGVLRVVATLELVQHQLPKMGHKRPPCDPKPYTSFRLRDDRRCSIRRAGGLVQTLQCVHSWTDGRWDGERLESRHGSSSRMRRHHRLRRQQSAPRKPLVQVRSPTPDYLSAQTQMVHSLRLPRWVGSPNEMRNKAHQLTTR